jgi:hypothetical protein
MSLAYLLQTDLEKVREFLCVERTQSGRSIREDELVSKSKSVVYWDCELTCHDMQGGTIYRVRDRNGKMIDEFDSIVAAVICFKEIASKSAAILRSKGKKPAMNPRTFSHEHYIELEDGIYEKDRWNQL